MPKPRTPARTLALVAVAAMLACGWPPSLVRMLATPTPFLPLPPTPTLAASSTPTPAPSETPSPTSTTAPTPTEAPTPSAQVIEGPYLQSMTTNSVIVVWETDGPLPSDVAFGQGEQLAQKATDTSAGARHAVTLSGLLPGTVYRYRLESLGWPLTGEFSFRTAPAAGSTEFTFGVIGDTRSGHQIHRAAIEALAAAQPAFVLHTGDLVGHGSTSGEWDRFFSIEQPLLESVPLFPSLGNHDENSSLYFDRFHLPGNERWYSFDWGEARFIALEIDAIVPFGTNSEQYAWLENALASNTQRWLIVYFHIPPYSALDRGDDMGAAVRSSLVPLFEKYGVDLVFTGHDHNYQRAVVGGITYVVTGGGGAELYDVTRPLDETREYFNGHHYMLVTLAGGELKGQAIALDGKVVDSFTLKKD